MLPQSTTLQSARLDDGGALAVLDSTAAGASSLKSLDDLERLLVSDLAEDDVAAVEPRGDNSGDEELGAVAMDENVSSRSEAPVVTQLDRRTYVLGPALAMESRPGLSWVSLKFSSPNFSP